MRKIFGLLIGISAIFFLAMAYSQFARAEITCGESTLSTQIVALVQSDKSNILELQLKLTALKLAQETLGANVKTVESYVKAQEALLTKLDKDEVREKLRTLYQKNKNGEAIDSQRIQDALQDTVDKAKQGSYFDRKVRFKNKDLSAYVWAKMLSKDGSSEDESVYDMNDVSILWLQSEISEGIESETFRGSAPANLQEISTRVAQLTGVATNTGTGLTKVQITEKIAKVQQEIGDEFHRVAGTFTDDQKKACAEIATCPDCQLSDAQKEGALTTALKQIGSTLIKDDAARQAMIKKTAAALIAKGYTITRDPSEVKEAEADALAGSPTPSAPSTSSTLSADYARPYVLNPNFNPNPTQNTFNFGGFSFLNPKPDSAKSVTRSASAVLIPSTDLNLSHEKADQTRVVKPIIPRELTRTTATEKFSGPLKFSTDYDLAKTSTRYRYCSGTFSFERVGNALQMKFSIVDGKSFRKVCEGSFPVKSMEVKAWSDSDALRICQKQNPKFRLRCLTGR
jgi:hypothetical protein